jgi:hypothetical protein
MRQKANPIICAKLQPQTLHHAKMQQRHQFEGTLSQELLLTIQESISNMSSAAAQQKKDPTSQDLRSMAASRHCFIHFSASISRVQPLT